MLNVTADTNILISATIVCGKEFYFLSLARQRRFNLYLSLAIIEECFKVLLRPKFGFSNEQVLRSIKHILSISTIVIPTRSISIIKDDPSDNRILECAASSNSDYIVSGDHHLLHVKGFDGIRIITTTEFLRILKQ